MIRKTSLKNKRISSDACKTPYGGINDELRSQMKMDVALWDVDPEDWKDRNKKTIVDRVMNQAGDGRTILIHDIYRTSADAADEIIKSSPIKAINW